VLHDIRRESLSLPKSYGLGGIKGPLTGEFMSPKNVWEPTDHQSQAYLNEDPMLVYWDEEVHDLRNPSVYLPFFNAFAKEFVYGRETLLISISRKALYERDELPMVHASIWLHEESRTRTAFTCQYVPGVGYYLNRGLLPGTWVHTDDLKIALTTFCSRGALMPVRVRSRLTLAQYWIIRWRTRGYDHLRSLISRQRS
jgi:hypothetical protein